MFVDAVEPGVQNKPFSCNIGKIGFIRRPFENNTCFEICICISKSHQQKHVMINYYNN